jgi:Endosomal/lysosomal potassium channel TMEM175
MAVTLLIVDLRVPDVAHLQSGHGLRRAIPQMGGFAYSFAAVGLFWLSDEITEADQELHQLVHQVAPALLALPGVGPEVAGQVLISAGDNLDRIKSEALRAPLRHRPNPGQQRTHPPTPAQSWQ